MSVFLIHTTKIKKISYVSNFLLPLRRYFYLMMRLKTQYKVREMAGEHVVIMQGHHASDLTRIISLNESARYLWGSLEGREFDVEGVAELLVEGYEIDREQALADAQVWVAKLQECGLIEC